ncbi:TOMM precursor leader peptide-binding protein [Nocardia inohanensis]|uniref:TOMM precursor leader peptide-binding protein n=1 Tax=Nocardia inohanensis TaxID=209246 RepID=UPI00082A43FB|nr:TOMM precursor leader peptide-binding protein [Nocardia inohanensis]
MTKLAGTRGPILHPRITVLRRPDGAVQLGWGPGAAVILRPPGPPDAGHAFVRLLDGMHTAPEILWQAHTLGLEVEAARTLLDGLDAAGLLAHEQPRARLRRVSVYGRGPLADRMLDGLRRMGLRPRHIREYPLDCPEPDRPDLAVLTDALMPEPGLVRDLMRERVPHLQLRIRDGHGVIGPLVLPGETSCLRCADLHRCDRDADWPHLAAQLLGRVGYASLADLAATTAVALKEIETIAYSEGDYAPATLNTTLELDLESHRLEHRPWSPHPRCDYCAQGDSRSAPVPESRNDSHGAGM